MAISVREGHSDRLVSARSPQAKRVEIHNILMDNGVMMMSEAEAELLSFSADSPLELKPHGLHVMLTGLREPLTPESELKLALEFEKSGTIELSVAVRKLSNSPVQYQLSCD